jgi:L-ascorbate metabolism protein UlaG (beta-lactamase superfamily)
MRLRWFGQSAFLLSAGAGSVMIDPFDGPLARERGTRWDYPDIEGVEPDLLLITHEHFDHSNQDAIGGDPQVIRSTAGKFETKFGDVLAIASEHDPSAGTERGPNAIFSFELDGLRICHLGDLGQSALRDEQLAAIGKPDVLMVPVGGHFTIDAEAAAEVVRVLDPAVVVPMHYGSPAVGLPLAPVEDFLALMEGRELRRADAAELELERPAEGMTVVVPAAP